MWSFNDHTQAMAPEADCARRLLKVDRRRVAITRDREKDEASLFRFQVSPRCTFPYDSPFIGALQRHTTKNELSSSVAAIA